MKWLAAWLLANALALELLALLRPGRKPVRWTVEFHPSSGISSLDAGWRTYPNFTDEEECDRFAKSMLRRYQDLTFVTCIQNEVASDGSFQVVDRHSFGRGFVSAAIVHP